MSASETPTTSKLKVSIQTLGCRLNQYEADGIMNRFEASGRYVALTQNDLATGQTNPGGLAKSGGEESRAAADIAIINTCTVTDQADSRNRNAIKAALKKNPNCRVIVTGCFAQTDPEKLREIPGVKLVVGNDRKPALFELIDELIQNEEADQKPGEGRSQEQVAEHQASYHPEPARFRDHAINGQYGLRPVLENPFGYGDVVPFGHTRAYMKIQDGCDRRCTYCKIPMARGRGISRSLTDILEHVRRLDDAGVPEIVLTGVNLGWYRDANTIDSASGKSLRFAGLIEKILETLSYGRLRLSSIEPCDVDEALGELSLHPRFCDFVHVPLQSGSAKILKAMRRTYSPFSFLKRMEKIRSVNPQLFCGTDVIVGFPGESEADFADSLQLCADTGMANIHGFRYSPRSGTPAANFADHISHGVVRERMNRLIQAKEAGHRQYAATQLGQVREGVVEKLTVTPPSDLPGAASEGIVAGEALSDNYLRIGFAMPESLAKSAGIQKGGLARFALRDLDQASGALSGELVDVVDATDKTAAAVHA
ncbi:MAG: tRNA (N(6)-L-threonylcarbamoyladenosine(37)-C(2))-methylthiotransferase MtaB [bacterium]|nr:tRNA (N(6)-L-threonylcarbamoyladenosine(37)-C(2))-methylthiotransferase MtaB [bacterium]